MGIKHRFFSSSFIPVMHGSSPEDLLHLDLSVSTSKFSLTCLQDPTEMEKEIISLLQKTNKKIAFGGYLERRKLYERSKHFNTSKTKRTIHLGLDFWSRKDSLVCAPANGTIHSVKNNNKFGDYGPTVILEHHDNEGVYYTLYGHLSTSSIKGLEKGQSIRKGASFARLGGNNENGNYAPHLHFQIILDLQGIVGDYPGVCSEETLEFYKENCPDPNDYLGLK